MVEHAAVNRGVVGSSPTGGATRAAPPLGGGAVSFKAEGTKKLGPLAQLVRADGS